MVCGKLNRIISFNQFYIFGSFSSLPLCLNLCMVAHRCQSKKLNKIKIKIELKKLKKFIKNFLFRKKKHEITMDHECQI